jgi:hypothetical protein
MSARTVITPGEALELERDHLLKHERVASTGS